MNFNDHSRYKNMHAFLGASRSSWLRYDEKKLRAAIDNKLALEKATKLHEYAALAISLGQKAPKSKKTISAYINDAIGFKMIPEQMLFYSENCFGTADAIIFRDGILRIHDLKTGKIPASMSQLEIYAALFCLEYRIKPNEIEIELRIYQNNEIVVGHPDPTLIFDIMEKIVAFDKIIKGVI